MVLSMDHSQFQQNYYNQSLGWAFQTRQGRKSAEASQPADLLLSFDGLPQFNADHYFMVASTAPEMLNEYVQMPNSYISSPSDAPVLSPVMSRLGETAGGYSGYSYDCSTHFSTNDQHSPARTFANVPRTSWNGPCDARTLNNSTQISLPIYEHHTNLAQIHEGASTVPRLEQRGRIEDYTMLDTMNQMQTSNSPSSTCSDEDEQVSHEQTMMDVGTDDQNTDGPYAKLIYRALMSAPNHSMVLQEIYRWFRENTSKGSSEGKGWMNSIRHNLSMNAVSLFLSQTVLVYSGSYEIRRHLRRRSARFQEMRPKSLQNGFCKISPSGMEFSLPLDIARELEQRGTSGLKPIAGTTMLDTASIL
ncbi:hypothetical protein ACMFMG_000125 [Clarireedia jacksonii]